MVFCLLSSLLSTLSCSIAAFGGNRGDRRLASPYIHSQLILAAPGRHPIRFNWQEAVRPFGYTAPPPKPRARYNGPAFAARKTGWRTVDGTAVEPETDSGDADRFDRRSCCDTWRAIRVIRPGRANQPDDLCSRMCHAGACSIGTCRDANEKIIAAAQAIAIGSRLPRCVSCDCDIVGSAD